MLQIVVKSFICARNKCNGYKYMSNILNDKKLVTNVSSICHVRMTSTVISCCVASSRVTKSVLLSVGLCGVREFGRS